HPARGWRGAGLGSSPHGPPAPRRLPVPRGGREMWPAGIEPRLRGVVAERLGVGPEDLQPDVSLTADLAADSLDLIDVGLALEAVVADALRAGPGARLEMELSASTDDAGLAATRKRFAWLAGRGVAVSVQRDPRAA